jgi:uncharacterized protein (DUF885 family)
LVKPGKYKVTLTKQVKEETTTMGEQREFEVAAVPGDGARAEKSATPATPEAPKQDKTPEVKREPQTQTQPPPKPDEASVPDLGKLVAQPRNEMLLVVQRYEADRGNLNRAYAISGSPTRNARLKRFYSGWLAALQELDAEKFGEEGRADYTRLKESLQRELRELDLQAKTQTEVAPLVPFAPTVIGLEEARRRMERIDPVKAAALLTEVKKQIDQVAKAAPEGNKVNKDVAVRAVESVTRLRTTLKSWFGFYNGYDPLFTWWMEQPYKEVDQALQAYATLLREKVGEEKTDENKTGEAKEDKGPQAIPVEALRKDPDVPDLRELVAFPQSEMRGVIRQYQAGRGGAGRGGLRPPPADAPGAAERQARQKKQNEEWLAALGKLDFDNLSEDGRADYVLLRNLLDRDLRRLSLEGKERPEPFKDNSGIAGRPIGREGLLAELAGEMVSYTPEELIAIAEKEFVWCEAEMKKASREMGFGDDWHKAVEKVKAMHVEPGRQPEMIRDLAREAIDYLGKHGLVTVPPLAAETWRMEMMSPQRQLVNPFFTGGETISVSFPTNTMSHEAKLQSMRGNNIPFSRATVHHELIPGHHLQGFMAARYRTHRGPFGTAFWTEGWALYWEMVLYDRGFPRTPEDRVGFLFWRMHRCARIVFSLNFHLGKMSPQECIDYLVQRVGHERDNAAAEVRRSFATSYGPLYQAAYMLGGLQIRALRKELVDSGKMGECAFHDAILKENRIPIAMVRAILTKQKLSRDFVPGWKFCSESPATP